MQLNARKILRFPKYTLEYRKFIWNRIIRHKFSLLSYHILNRKPIEFSTNKSQFTREALDDDTRYKFCFIKVVSIYGIYTLRSHIITVEYIWYTIMKQPMSMVTVWWLLWNSGRQVNATGNKVYLSAWRSCE